MATNAELTTQLAEMTTRANAAEKRAEQLTQDLETAVGNQTAAEQKAAEQAGEIEKLNLELRQTRSSLKAFKGSATRSRNEMTILRKELSPEPRHLGAMKSPKSDEEAVDRTAALEAAIAAGITEIAFSDGKREIRELAPLSVTGDAFRRLPNWLVLNSEPELDPGACEREVMHLRGFALLNEAGDQVAYSALPEPILIRRSMRFRLPLNTIRFAI